MKSKTRFILTTMLACAPLFANALVFDVQPLTKPSQDRLVFAGQPISSQYQLDLAYLPQDGVGRFGKNRVLFDVPQSTAYKVYEKLFQYLVSVDNLSAPVAVKATIAGKPVNAILVPDTLFTTGVVLSPAQEISYSDAEDKEIKRWSYHYQQPETSDGRFHLTLRDDPTPLN